MDYTNVFEFDVLHAVIVIDFLFAKESILITIAAVLIGIYFGISTHLLIAYKNSALFSLAKKTIQELISFLKIALLAAFVYLLWTLFHPYMYFESHIIHFIIELTLGVFSYVYVFGSCVCVMHNRSTELCNSLYSCIAKYNNSVY